MSAGASSAQAAELEPCTTAGTLERADDPAPSEVTLPFPVKFYGKQFTTAWVTNHGKVAFRDFAANPAEEPVGQGFGAYTFSHNTESVIGPFLGDLDTSNNGGTVSWGTTTVEGRAAFCVNWEDVKPFRDAAAPTTDRNTFQMLLVKQGTGGNFEMRFNYEKLQWATYDVFDRADDPLTLDVNEALIPRAEKAVAGYSAGPHHQATGDFVTLRGGDEDTGTLLGDSNVGVDGRFVFSGCNATLCPEPVVTPTPTPTVPRPNPTPVPQVTAPASSGSVITALPPVRNTIATTLGRAGKLRFSGSATLLLPVTCSLQARGGCQGTVTLKAKGIIVGTGRVAKLAPGRSATVRITLSRKGRALLKKGRKMKLTANAVLRDDAGTKQTVSSVLTIKAARR